MQRYKFPETPPRANYIVTPHEKKRPIFSVFMKDFRSFEELGGHLKDLEREIKAKDAAEFLDPLVGYDVKCHQPQEKRERFTPCKLILYRYW